jgi:hypothetical protein
MHSHFSISTAAENDAQYLLSPANFQINQDWAQESILAWL